MSKYIIKNCPACIYDKGEKKVCTSRWLDYTECEKNTDCIMKQIVDECKRGINYSQCNCGAVGNLVNILNTLEMKRVLN